MASYKEDSQCGQQDKLVSYFMALQMSKSSVSQASTYAEMADFWDEHDLSDYWGKTRSVKANVALESDESLYAIEKGLSQTICRAAKKERGVSPHTLINLWLQERMQKLKLDA